MKYEDLKCEFCDGVGRKENNIDGMDCPTICLFCDGTGIDHHQLMKFPKVVKIFETLRTISKVNQKSAPFGFSEET